MPAVTVSPSQSTVIVPADSNRTLVFIVNTSATSNCHINFGLSATTNEAYLAPGATLTLTGDSRGKSAINGLSSSGSIIVKYSRASTGT